MPQVIFYTQAYNAEKTLERSIKSVLSQTHTNWIWYLIDNGSRDSTGKIIEDYARADKRIIHQRVEPNIPGYLLEFIPTIPQIHSEEDFFTSLDADDEYMPDFLEEMLAFMGRERLEIAACGSFFLDAQTGKVLGQRILQGDLILEEQVFSDCFLQYHQFMRTVWGKLYSVSLLKKLNSTIESIYGSDTMFCMKLFNYASRVGILSKSLHKYYVSPKSVSYRFDPKRIESDRILHKAAQDYLINKCGAVSSRNEGFLMVVYMNALKDTLNVLLNAQISTEEKLAGVIDMFIYEYTGQLMAREHFGLGIGSVSELSAQRRELFSTALSWLLSQDEVPIQLVENYCETGERLSAAIEAADEWLFFKKLRLRFLLAENRQDEAKLRLSELIELIPNDPEIAEFKRLL